MNTHLEFMLPDGAWDNSWGTRSLSGHIGADVQATALWAVIMPWLRIIRVPGGYSPQYTITEKIDG